MVMEGGKIFDIDLDIENFYDFFADEPLTEPQSSECSENNFQGPATLKKVTFRVMKNDIRRYYAEMFMNTVNSGDFNKLQGFFSTFMMGPGKFVINHDNFDEKYRLPPILTAEGPKLAVHFLLGMFVMYPDTIIQMTNTRITTSNTWSGTKIEIGVNVLATKIFDLSDEEWIPQLEILNEKCNKLAEEKRNRLKYNIPDVASTDSNNNGTTSSASNGGSGRSRSTAAGDDCCSVEGDNDDSKDGKVGKDGMDEGGPANKRRRATRTTARADGAHTDGNNDFISEEYVRALCAQATLLSKPMQISMAGVVSLFLDENNHIQHMNIRTRPT